MPAFNIAGETKVNSVIGGVFTTFVIMMSLIYAGIKMIELINHDNSDISKFV